MWKIITEIVSNNYGKYQMTNVGDFIYGLNTETGEVIGLNCFGGCTFTH